ncbi:single-stranded-DNA-specific exonuclease RecJ [Candidatus Parcubacteria bacterium]|nr:single-stranded-DNA-specific exonuclease RecJ [Candidatus Parcubacteria bacterium]
MSFPEILENLLKHRGVTEELKEAFLNPSYAKLHDPLLLPDMEKARDRVIEAMQKGEHIFVFSDYDADGIPGAVVLSDFFKRAKYENVSFYIPHRHDEGFGLSTEAIDVALEKGAKLLITVDCGIADIEEVKYAKKKKLDVIITDHHLEKEVLPPALAVVDPVRKDSEYPFKEICGAAVAYKLVQAILQKESFGIKEGMEKWSLDMVGIATLSDMVPLVGENRILAKFGLEVLKKTERPGLAALFRKLRIDQRFVTEDDIAFMITPRINAASRMGKPEDAFNLLATTSPIEADRLADHLEKINSERKGVVAALVKDAKKHMEARESINDVIVIGNPEWRPALLGLVANTLVEEYKRPVFVWGRDGDGTLKGSCRSYNGYHLADLMLAAGDAFIEFGGHANAGGFSIALENLPTLEEKLSLAIKNLAVGPLDTRGGPTAIQIEAHEVCEDLWKIISTLAPFGVGNEKPVFEIKNAEISSVRQFGKTGDHLEVLISSPKGKDVKCISFFATPESFSSPVAFGSRVTLRGNLEKSYFMNRPEIRLRIVDIR